MGEEGGYREGVGMGVGGVDRKVGRGEGGWVEGGGG